MEFNVILHRIPLIFKVNKLSFLLFLSFPLFVGCKSDGSNSYLDQLDHEITLKKEYDREKEERLVQLKRLLNQSSDVEVNKELLWEIINEYRTYRADSAETYSIKLVDFGNENDSKEAESLGLLGLMDSYISVGYFKEAADIQQTIDEDALPQGVKPFYLNLVYKMFEILGKYDYAQESGMEDIYREQKIELLNEIIESTDSTGYIYEAALVELNQLKGADPDKIISQRLGLLQKYGTDKNLTSIQNYKIGSSYLERGKLKEAEEFLSKAAISDIKNSSKNGEAIKNLAILMFDDNKKERSAIYMQKTSEDTEFFGSQLKKVELSSLLSVLDQYAKNRTNNSTSSHGKMVMAVIVLALLVILIVILFINVIKREGNIQEISSRVDKFRNKLALKDKELLKLQEKLKESHADLKKRKEINDHDILVSFFDNMKIINQIETRIKNINRKSKEISVDEGRLVDILGIKEERQRVWKGFDESFMKLYPNFIEEINTLLKPEDRFVIGDRGELPVDLRIFALTRLGVKDPAEIAKFLNLSVNTVYVYKTKLKSKSLVNNNDFEKYLMNIKN